MFVLNAVAEKCHMSPDGPWMLQHVAKESDSVKQVRWNIFATLTVEPGTRGKVNCYAKTLSWFSFWNSCFALSPHIYQRLATWNKNFRNFIQSLKTVRTIFSGYRNLNINLLKSDFADCNKIWFPFHKHCRVVYPLQGQILEYIHT
jgi:hypothetical protein